MPGSEEEVSPAMADLSSYIEGAIGVPLPEEVVERAKIHIVDAFAAMISGSQLLPGRQAISYMSREASPGESGIAGSQLRTSASNAALANGMLAHADESDDVHPSSGTHPGSSIVPGALAIGQRNGLSGAALLRSIVLGYDVCARHVHALGFHEMRRLGLGLGSHAQSFGVAAAASALLGLSARQIRHVWSYNAATACGLETDKRDTEHVQKAFVVGRAAQNGVDAALMVESGFSGVEDSFSGPFNYFAVYSPNADLSQLTKGLGLDFEVMRTAIKCWTTGGPTQAPLSVLRHFIVEHDLTPDQVEKVVVRMPAPDAGVVDNREMPDINVQHLIATMLVDGNLTYQSSHDYARLEDPEVLAVRQRVELVKDPSMVEAVRRWRCEMEVELRNGGLLKEELLAVKGTLDNPMNREEETEKAAGLIAPVLGSGRTDTLLAALWDLDHLHDVRELRELVAL